MANTKKRRKKVKVNKSETFGIGSVVKVEIERSDIIMCPDCEGRGTIEMREPIVSKYGWVRGGWYKAECHRCRGRKRIIRIILEQAYWGK